MCEGECVRTVECLQVSSNSVVYLETQLVLSFHLIILSLSQGTLFKIKVWKRDGLWSVQKYLADGIVVIQRLISLSHYSCSDTRPPQVVPAAFLAKPQSNHLNLLCALRGHPVTLSPALNMCCTIHIHLNDIK